MSGRLAGHPPAVSSVSCGGKVHSIRWEAGNLVPLDHADPSGERSLAALGGLSCTCVDVLSAWQRRRSDARLLCVLTRGTTDPAGAPAAHSQMRAFAQAQRAAAAGRRQGWVASAPLRSVGSARVVGTSGGGFASFGRQLPHMHPVDEGEAFREDATLLAGLGRSMATRLAATVTASLLDHSAEDPTGAAAVRPALEASLYGRVVCTLREWSGRFDLELDFEVVDANAAVLERQNEPAGLHVALPLDWVVDVWGRELATIGPYFAIAAIESGADRTILQVVDATLASNRDLTISVATAGD